MHHETEQRSSPLKTVAILAVFALGILIAYNEYFERAGYWLPSYDNSMLHAGRARVIIETGHYAETEVVFGGGTPTYHVPIYPALVAGTSMLGGVDLAWAERLIGLVFAILLPFGFYLLARGISGDWRAGATAALLALYSTALMQWATRNSPISIGNVLVPLGLYFILQGDVLLAVASAAILALDHPPSLLVFTLSALFFVVADFAWEMRGKMRQRRVPLDAKTLLGDVFARTRLAGIAGGLAAFATYLAWHVRQTGLACLNFACLPQRAAHEFGRPVPLLDYFASAPHYFAVAGVLALPLYPKVSTRAKLLAFSYLFATLLLVKNDLLGIATFTERFVTYLDGAVAVFGGIALSAFLAFLRGE